MKYLKAMAQSKSFGRGHWLSLSLLLPITPALAQSIPVDTTGVFAPAPSNDPADRLAANLLLLSQNPRNIVALTEAGKSAIAVGDYDAALSFLGRAEELAPNDGRVKAALGSALVMVERAADAIRLFSEASALGVTDGEIARDRGLAYDLQGDSKRAQRDYQIALRNRPDDEVTRRLALSLGISGDRDQALRVLDPLLRKQDMTGWRARAFVLAMNGNLRDAEGIATRVMPSGMGDTMRPFLRRLASLSAADRAHAVNFGTMPSDSTRFASADSGTLIPAPDLASATAGESLAKARKADPSSKASRRRPGREEVALASSSQPKPVETAQIGPGFSDIFAKSVAVAKPKPETPKPVLEGRLDQRVGTRIGPVDPERLSPEVRALLARNDVTPPPKAILVPNSVFDRPGDAVIRPAVPAKPTTKAPEPEELDQPGNAVFEVPVKQTPKIEAKPAAILASVAIPKAVDAKAVDPKPVLIAPAPKPVVETVLAQKPVLVETPPTLKPITEALPAAIIVGGPPIQGPPAETPPVQSVAAQATPVQLAVAPPPAQIAVQPAAVTVVAQPTPTPTPTPTQEASRGLTGLLADIQPEKESVAAALPSAVEIKIARLAAQRKLTDAAAKAKAEKEGVAKVEKAEADRKDAEATALAKRNPARVWVQVATGANESGLGITWKRLREKAPDTFKGLSAAYVPFKATNRVLVGPFKSSGEARALINAMSKAGLSGNSFSSDPGQEISKIAAK